MTTYKIIDMANFFFYKLIGTPAVLWVNRFIMSYSIYLAGGFNKGLSARAEAKAQKTRFLVNLRRFFIALSELKKF